MSEVQRADELVLDAEDDDWLKARLEEYRHLLTYLREH